MRRELLVSLLILAGAAVFPAVAQADVTMCDANNVCLTTASTSMSVTEGGTFAFMFTLTDNNSSQGIVLTGVSEGVPTAFPATPDPSDFINGGSVNFGTCTPPGNALAPGGSCSFTNLYTTDSGAGEQDGDSGTWTEGGVGIEYALGSSSTITNYEPFDVTLTVNDPVPTPEPATIWLLAPIVLGLTGIRFRSAR